MVHQDISAISAKNHSIITTIGASGSKQYL